jgi:hypothetical protein
VIRPDHATALARSATPRAASERAVAFKELARSVNAPCIGQLKTMYVTDGQQLTAGQVDRARRLCRQCPETCRDACMVEGMALIESLGMYGDAGIWAGMSDRDRQRFRRHGMACAFQCSECKLWSTIAGLAISGGVQKPPRTCDTCRRDSVRLRQLRQAS